MPFVVETWVGADRTFLAVMTSALQEEEVPDADGGTAVRTVLKLHPALSPVKVAVLPQVAKDALAYKARQNL